MDFWPQGSASPEAVLGDRVADWSSLEPKAFWRMMEQNGYCWPIDADGNRRPYAAIPASIGDLTDNVWRTLARRVRGEAFEDLDTPFQEFMWGDYFRKKHVRQNPRTSNYPLISAG